MSPTDYVTGVALFAAMLAGGLAGAWLLLRKRYGYLTGAPRALAYGMLATLGVLAIHLVPLALGVLGRITVLVATAAWLLAAALTPSRKDDQEPAPPAVEDGGRVAWACTALAGAALGFVALALVRDKLTVAPAGVDQLNFHMPGIAAWIQTGSLWQIDAFLPDLAPGHYPNNGDVLSLATVLPWDSDFLVHFVMLPFWVLTGLGVYALAVELGVARATAAMGGLVLMAVPAVSVSALNGGLVDALMLFGFVVGLLFLARHNRTGRTSELVLAGLALGVSFGTKWYAVSSVAVVVAVWAVARGWSRRRWTELVRQTAAVTGLIMLGGGIWLLRNLVESANPFMPVKVSVLGTTIFDAPVDRVRSLGGFSIADYLDAPGVWQDYILPQLRDAVAAPAALVLLGVVVAAVVLAAARARRIDGPDPRWGYPLAGLAMAVLLGVAYGVTPYTAGGAEGKPTLVAADARYLVPTLIVAAVLAAWAAGRVRHGPAVFGVLGLAAVLDGAVQLEDLAFLNLRFEVVAQTLLVVAVAGLAVVVAYRRGLHRDGVRLASPAVTAAVVVVAAAVVVAGGRKLQQDFMAKRYYGSDVVADTLSAKVQSGYRIGLAGVWSDEGLAPPLLAFGPRLRNHVEYVGRDDMDVWRRFRTREGFTRRVDQQRYEWLVVGRGRPPKPSVNEERWARAAGFRVVARSPRLTLLRRAPG